MKRATIILTLIFSACLLMSSQALAGGDYGKSDMKQGEMAVKAAAQVQNLDSEQITEMQRLLKEQGYEVGSTDGEMNSETHEAIRQFQQDQGLAVTGDPNQETLRALAPTSDQQEFFGLSPEFGEMEEKAEEAPQEKSY